MMGSAGVMTQPEEPKRRTIPPVRREMGRRIKEARNTARLTQGEVAYKLSQAVGRDIPRQTYQHYETGFASIESLTLAALAKILGTTVDHLLGNTASEIPPGVIAFFEEVPKEDREFYERVLRQEKEREEWRKNRG